MATLASLLRQVRAAALTDPFTPPRDLEVYTRFKRDPVEPICFAGNLTAPICLLGRDLGRDEVRHQQPLIGAAGRLVRRTLQQCVAPDLPEEPPFFPPVLDRVLITNLVPYKPAGNAPFSPATQEVFRPFVAMLLTKHWTGAVCCPLGEGALRWFYQYDPEAIRHLLGLPIPERARADVAITLQGKPLRLLPLPHPSPLSRYSRTDFPVWLRERWEAV